MSTAELNPYHSGNFEPAKLPPGSAQRPVGLLVFCILILAFSSMGMLGNIVGGVMLGFAGGKVDFKQQFGSQPNMEVNPEALNRLQVFSSIQGARNMGLLVAGLVVGSLLILGSIAAIYPFRWGSMVLTLGCAAAILFAIGQGVVMMMNSQEIVGVMKDYPDDFYRPSGDMDERAVEMVHTIIRITYQAVPIITWVMTGVKAVFYVIVMLYLRKNNVQQFIQGAAVA